MPLSKSEKSKLISLIKKLAKHGDSLDAELFEALCGVVPFAACELVVVGPKGLLLTWRQDKWWRGWHFPGGILRHQEEFKTRIANVAKDELGIKLSDFKFLCPINYTKAARGHVVSLVFLCHTKTAPKHGKFFTKMPKDIIAEHKRIWGELARKKFVA